MPRRSKDEKRLFFLLIVLAIALIYSIITKVVEFFQNNLGIIIFFIVILAIVAITFFIFKSKFKKKKITKELSDLPEKIKEVKDLLDSFNTDIPKYSKHTETVYQVDFGRYLKDNLPKDKVEYEPRKGTTRVDILINSNLAIEIKALKTGYNRYNMSYNKQHIDSIFSKIFMYKEEYPELIVILFNAKSVENWKEYKQMKKVAKQQGVYIFEK